MQSRRPRSSAFRWASSLGCVALGAVAVMERPTTADAAPCAAHYDVDSLNGIVTDEDTRLMWQRAADGATRTLSEASDYCEALSLGGHDDWRLPSIFELQTIVEESSDAPAIDVGAFDGGGAPENGVYWSGTKAALDPSYAWTVDFGINSVGGQLFYYEVTVTKNRARCVR
jgi:hypothetical protein